MLSAIALLLHMAHRLTVEQRTFVLKEWWKTGKTHQVHDAFVMKFPGCQPPSKQALYKLRKKFDTTGSCANAQKCGRKRTARTDENLQNVAELFALNPQTSTRRASYELDIDRRSVQRILHDLKLRAYRPTLLQALRETDFHIRHHFSTVFLNQLSIETHLMERILWTDEAIFKLNGTVNTHNCVYWADANPHFIVESELNAPGVCVWAGIWPRGIIGPFFFDGTVTAQSYLHMLTHEVMPLLQQNQSFQQMIWQQDGAPAHYGLTVRQYLDEHFHGRWIGRQGPIDWPPRSPDLTPMDFAVWGIVKERVYSRKPKNINELKDFIQEELQGFPQDLCERICYSVPTRLQKCAFVEGHQFQHLL